MLDDKVSHAMPCLTEGIRFELLAQKTPLSGMILSEKRTEQNGRAHVWDMK